jgi:hypothetical protein
MPRFPHRLHGVPHPTVREVIVDDAAGLEGGVGGRRPDEPEARAAQALRQGGRLGDGRLPVGLGARWDVHVGLMRPEKLVQRRARGAQLDRRPGVRDCGLDLATVPDDRGVAEQPLDVPFAEPGNAIRVEALERRAERLPLTQDRDPGEAGLEALEAEALVDTLLGRDRTTPLLVVVGVVQRVGRLPAALQLSSTSTITIPSSTVTG